MVLGIHTQISCSFSLLKYNIIVSLIGFLFQVIFLLLLLPIYGIIGAAISNILVYTIMSVLMIVFYKKILSYREENLKIVIIGMGRISINRLLLL